MCFFHTACSAPFGVVFTDVGETTLSLTWSEPAVPNGIVEEYMVIEVVHGTILEHMHSIQLFRFPFARMQTKYSLTRAQ